MTATQPAQPAVQPSAIPASQVTKTPPEIAARRTVMHPVRMLLIGLFIAAFAISYRTGLIFLPLTIGLFERDALSIGTTFFSPQAGFTRLSESPEPVTELYIDQNQNIHTLPENIGFLTDLEVLFIGSQKFTTLPESIGNLTKLRELRIYNTPVAKLPDSIGNLTNLRVLEVVGGELTQLPDSVGNLTNLTEINLAYNKLTGLPPYMGNLLGLEYLDVTGNRLRSVPTGMPSDLDILFIAGNPIPWNVLSSVGASLPVYY